MKSERIQKTQERMARVSVDLAIKAEDARGRGQTLLSETLTGIADDISRKATNLQNIRTSGIENHS